jgi:carboxypeptidase C (cathepsin A)
LFFKFPERQSNDLWLSGESYAGIYVPYLAWEIDQYNALGGFKINLKGFLVGNGVTNWKYDTTPAYVEMGFWHGLYDIDLYEQFIKNDCIK